MRKPLTSLSPVARALVPVVLLFSCLAGPARPSAALPEPIPTGPDGQAVATPTDSLRTVPSPGRQTLGGGRSSRWGLIPARTPAGTGLFTNRPRPGWEKAAMVPYHLVGIPLKLLGTAGYESLKFADNLGWFDMPPAEHLGLPLPGRLYLMPDTGYSESEGISYGLGLSRYDLPTTEAEIRLQASSSTKRARVLALGTYFPLNDERAVQLGLGYTGHPLTRFFGVGPESRAGDLSYYHRESWWVGLESDHDLGHGFGVEVRVFHSRVRSGSTRYHVHRQLERIHADEMPLGFGQESHGMTYRLGLMHDSSRENARPQRGGFRKLSVSRFMADDGSDLEFNVYRADLEQFFPLWHTRRTLAVRAFFNHIDNKGDVEVPFARLMTFAKPDLMRGFTDERWLGKGTIGFSAEYRWPIWAVVDRVGSGLDAYIFSDVGQVFMQTEEIALEEMQVNGGVGLRLLGGERNFLGRLEVGFSRESTQFSVKFSQTFQYDKKGLLGGKDPTRRR